MIKKIKEQSFKKMDRIKGFIDPRSIEVIIDEDIEKHLKDKKKKTILYIGIRYAYGHKNRGLSYEHYNFYKTFENMDYSLIYFDYDTLIRKYGKIKASKILLDIVDQYQPDYLFYFHYLDWISHSVWEKISETQTKTIIWLADDHWRYEETRPIWTLFDLVVTTDKNGYNNRIKDNFKNVVLSQWAYNHFIYTNMNLQKKYDVSFVGQCYSKRKEFINLLKKEGIYVETFGRGWKNCSRLSQTDLIKIYNQSKISLNISFAAKGDTIQIKGRDFEAPGCGSLLITAENDTLSEYFNVGKEIVTYKNAEDAALKIKYYLKNDTEREKIAKNGYDRIMREHTFEKRLKKILKYW
ncbi:MAG: glycosyltransferase [DPANN group archaeon]|nr:glycosyltransferase [DPANN group archaeon]